MRRLILPGLCTIAALAVLIALGTWQIERMHWKQAALAAIAAAEARPGVDLPAAPTPYLKVRAIGRLRFDLAALYGAEGRERRSGPVMGAQLLVPLERAAGPPVLVMLGWVPGLPAERAPREAGVEGYVRLPEPAGLFAATDDTAGRRFYSLDPAAIGPALGLRDVAPFVIVALGAPQDGQPEPARSLPRPSDNHLSYALTWYGLALGLVGVFFFFARKVLRA